MAKICIISPSLKLGGIERALVTLSEEFQILGHEIYFITCLKKPHFYTLKDEIKLFEPKFERSLSLTNKILFYPKLLFYIRKTVQKINPDRVLVFGDWFSPITLLALLGANYSVYISDRTIPNYKFKFPIPQLKCWLYPKAAGFIAQTNRSRDFKEVKFGNKLNIRVIPNALPKIQKSLLNEAKKNSILYVGRFEWEKDPEILIRSFAMVYSLRPDWKLEMAGDGPLFGNMKTLSNELGLSSNIIFHGKVKDVAKLYSEASIFVLPSVIEGFPNALIEAMSFGLLCICFRDIPYEEIVIPNKTGVILTERSARELADTIMKYINNAEEREIIGSNAMIIKAKFASNTIANEILNFMQL